MNFHIDCINTMKYLVNVFTIFILAVAVISCDDNSSNSNSDLLTTQPQIPSAQTLKPDLSPIVSSNSQGKSVSTLAIGQNFIEARQRGAVIGSFLGLNVAFPASLVGAASSTTPEMISPGVWEWNYMHENPLTSGNVESNLVATINADSGNVKWELQLDANGTLIEFQDFQILTGTSTLDGTSGQWNINAFSPETGNQNVATSSTWSIDTDSLLTLHSTIKLEFSPLTGDEFSFSQQDTLTTLTFTDVSESATTQISWNPATTSGKLITPGFNSGEPACWNENKEDIACSEIGL